MPFVLDASVVASWAFEDESHPVADKTFDRIRTDTAWVPSLWWFEVRNILVINERRQRIAEADTAIFLRDLSRLRVAVDRAPEEAVVLKLARQHRLTIYDASYLELARRESCALATLDKDIIRAARAESCPLIGHQA